MGDATIVKPSMSPKDAGDARRLLKTAVDQPHWLPSYRSRLTDAIAVIDELEREWYRQNGRGYQ